MMQNVVQEVEDVKPFSAGRWVTRLISAACFLFVLLLKVL